MASSTSNIKLDPVRALFGDAWRLYKERFVVATQIVALPVLLRLLAYVLDGIAGMQIAAAIIILVWWVVSFVSSIALISAIGRRTSLDESYRAGFALFWPAFFISIVSFFIALGGLIMLVIPGIMLIVWLAFANYTLVLEGRHGFNALMQSRAYVRGYWWAVFWRMLLLVIAMIVAAVVIGIVFGILLGNLTTLLVELFLVPFAVAFSYKLYENLRSLKPDVAEQKVPGAGKDFLVVSMIVGIVVLVCIALLGIFFASRVESSFQSKLVKQYEAQYANMHPPVLSTSTASSTATSTARTIRASFSPASGPVGTQVTIMVPSGELGATTTVLMRSLIAAKGVAVTTSADGQKVSFTVPESLAPNCVANTACPQFLAEVTAGSYELSVTSSAGVPIDIGTFTVTGTA